MRNSRPDEQDDSVISGRPACCNRTRVARAGGGKRETRWRVEQIKFQERNYANQTARETTRPRRGRDSSRYLPARISIARLSLGRGCKAPLERRNDGCAKFASPAKARHEEGREDPKIRERAKGRSVRFFPTKEATRGKRIGHAEYFIFEEGRILLFAALCRSERRQIRRVSLSARVSRVFALDAFSPVVAGPGVRYKFPFLLIRLSF